jgi:hypothetical protein
LIEFLLSTDFRKFKTELNDITGFRNKLSWYTLILPKKTARIFPIAKSKKKITLQLCHLFYILGTNGDEKPYDYVMKADDDIFIRLQKLTESLNPMPREDMYYGFVIPCDSMDPFRDYMSGMGYVLS